VGPRLPPGVPASSASCTSATRRAAHRAHRHRRRDDAARDRSPPAAADARVFVSSFDRPNIRYRIVEKDNARAQLLAFLRDEHAGDAGIVYCLSRRKVEETAAWLAERASAALPYHAGMDADERARNQDASCARTAW
jgi:superfamily II DNA helicase RecQ